MSDWNNDVPPDLVKPLRQATVARILRGVLIVWGAFALTGQILDPFGEEVAVWGAAMLLTLVVAISHGEDEVRARVLKFRGELND